MSIVVATLPVVEVFHSIQGEGRRTGEPATFLRLAGCNLRCTWCDTPYSWSAEGLRAAHVTSIDDLAEQVRERSVVLTGGEPMLHHRRLPLLIELVRGRGVEHVTVETNATIWDEELAQIVDLWSLSPKLPGSGEQADAGVIASFLREARDRVQLKFVVTGSADLAAMWSLLDLVDAPLPDEVLVQPDGTRPDYDVALQELVEHVLADPRRARLRVSSQLHRVVWGPAARGV